MHNLDAFAAKYTSAGAHVWSSRWGAAWDDRANGVGVDANGVAIVAGSSGGTIGGMISHGLDDGFVVAVSP